VGINFKALVVSKTEDEKYVREIKQRSTDDLPEGGVLVKVNYSSLNYKDALSLIIFLSSCKTCSDPPESRE